MIDDRQSQSQKSFFSCLTACTGHCSVGPCLLGVIFFLLCVFWDLNLLKCFFVFFFLCVFGVWRSSWLWIQHPVTAKNRLTFNRPTYLVTIRSTIREPWKTQWIYGNRKKKIRIFYPIDDLASRDCQYRLSFNCPTHLVNIRSTIREPWKTRMNIWQSFVVL